MSTLENVKELRENATDVSLNDNWREPRCPSPSDNNSSIWLTSFTDVIALMLVFFVMMFAMSKPKEYGWFAIVETMNNEFQSGVASENMTGTYGGVDMARVKHIKRLNTSYLSAILKNLRAKEPILQKISLISLSSKVRIAIKYEDIYSKDTPLEIKDSGTKILNALLDNIGHLQNTVDIMLLAPKPNIIVATKQAENIVTMFKKAGYEGKINIVFRHSDKTEIAIVIYSAK